MINDVTVNIRLPKTLKVEIEKKVKKQRLTFSEAVRLSLIEKFGPVQKVQK